MSNIPFRNLNTGGKQKGKSKNPDIATPTTWLHQELQPSEALIPDMGKVALSAAILTAPPPILTDEGSSDIGSANLSTNRTDIDNPVVESSP